MYVICIWSYEWWTEIWDLQCGPKIGTLSLYTKEQCLLLCVFTYSVYELVADDGRVARIGGRRWQGC